MSFKRWLFISAFLFGIGLVLGLAMPSNISGVLADDVNGLEELARFLAPLPQSLVFLIILVKNVSVLLMSFALSPVLCLVPIIALTFNGWILGLVATTVIQERSVGYLLAGLLPHGVLELPAIILGEAVALSFGASVLVALFNKGKRNTLLPRLRQNLRYLAVAIALLLPAALIETYITPLLLQ